MTLGDLFVPCPVQWGARGDPHLWEAMRRRFTGEPLPADMFALRAAVDAAFDALTGTPLGPGTGDLEIEAYRVGSGMSDGIVSGRWWYEVGRMLVLDRWNVVTTGRCDR